MSSSPALYCVDMGTTNCRVFLTEGSRVWARAEGAFGVRDVARGGSPGQLRERMEELMREAGRQAESAGLAGLPHHAVGAGMITSRQGLLEIPHLLAPVGEIDLARHMQRVSLHIAEPIDLLLAPGIRTGRFPAGLDNTLLSDVMRGEETLVTGLLQTGQMEANGVLLNLGSHWKWIWVNAERRIARSRTALTGELIHAAQSQTLLASGLPQSKPTVLHAEWMDRGRREARRSGLSRALFCVRLLEQAGHGSPEERLSFLYGAFLETELEAFQLDRSLRHAESISLIGPECLAVAWKRALEPTKREVRVVREEDRDQAYLAGLRRLFSLAVDQEDNGPPGQR